MQQFNKGKYESPYRSGSPGPDLRSSGNSSKLRFSDEQKELMPGKGILHLDWSNNGIFELDTLHSFSDLVSLNLAHNQLNMITAPIKSCTRLALLNLSHNFLTHIENLSTLQSLKALYITHNKIHRMESLDSLTKLEVLDLSYNQLTHVSNLWGNLNLKKLSLAHNKITSLGDMLQNIKLQTLDLRSNLLSDISNANECLPDSIRVLYFGQNKLIDILTPLHLSFLDRIDDLDFSQNPFINQLKELKIDYRAFIVLLIHEKINYLNNSAISGEEVSRSRKMFADKNGKFQKDIFNKLIAESGNKHQLIEYLIEQSRGYRPSNLRSSYLSQESNASLEESPPAHQSPEWRAELPHPQHMERHSGSRSSRNPLQHPVHSSNSQRERRSEVERTSTEPNYLQRESYTQESKGRGRSHTRESREERSTFSPGILAPYGPSIQATPRRHKLSSSPAERGYYIGEEVKGLGGEGVPAISSNIPHVDTDPIRNTVAQHKQHQIAAALNYMNTEITTLKNIIGKLMDEKINEQNPARIKLEPVHLMKLNKVHVSSSKKLTLVALYQGIIKLQALFRGSLVRHRIRKYKYEFFCICKVQALGKGYALRKMFKRKGILPFKITEVNTISACSSCRKLENLVIRMAGKMKGLHSEIEVLKKAKTQHEEALRYIFQQINTIKSGSNIPKLKQVVEESKAK